MCEGNLNSDTLRDNPLTSQQVTLFIEIFRLQGAYKCLKLLIIDK